jgi:hypothetical protein
MCIPHIHRITANHIQLTVPSGETDPGSSHPAPYHFLPNGINLEKPGEKSIIFKVAVPKT